MSRARLHEDLWTFAQRRWKGIYDVDPFGFDEDLTDHVLAPLLMPLERWWWRVAVEGIDNLPEHGPALLVANHGGVLPFDALMLALALRRARPGSPPVRFLAAELAFRLPLVSPLARAAGGALACVDDAERLLRAGAWVGDFPEGYRGLGKRWWRRGRVGRFGNGGAIRLALRTGATVLPVAIEGSDDIYPMLADIRPLARLLGLPYVPVTPTFPWLGPLGMVPLPVPWTITVCPALDLRGLSAQDAENTALVHTLTEHVRSQVQAALDRRPLTR